MPCSVHSRAQGPSADRCHAIGLVPPSCFPNTSTAYSRDRVASMLQPATGRGSLRSRRCSSGWQASGSAPTRTQRVHPRNGTHQRSDLCISRKSARSARPGPAPWADRKPGGVPSASVPDPRSRRWRSSLPEELRRPAFSPRASAATRRCRYARFRCSRRSSVGGRRRTARSPHQHLELPEDLRAPCGRHASRPVVPRAAARAGAAHDTRGVQATWFHCRGRRSRGNSSRGRTGPDPRGARIDNPDSCGARHADDPARSFASALGDPEGPSLALGSARCGWTGTLGSRSALRWTCHLPRHPWCRLCRPLLLRAATAPAAHAPRGDEWMERFSAGWSGIPRDLRSCRPLRSSGHPLARSLADAARSRKQRRPYRSSPRAERNPRTQQNCPETEVPGTRCW